MVAHLCAPFFACIPSGGGLTPSEYKITSTVVHPAEALRLCAHPSGIRIDLNPTLATAESVEDWRVVSVNSTPCLLGLVCRVLCESACCSTGLDVAANVRCLLAFHRDLLNRVELRALVIQRT